MFSSQSPEKTKSYFSRKNKLQFIKTNFKILLLLVGLSQFSQTFATTYKTNWLTVSVDDCSGIATIDFVLYCDEDGASNDDGWKEGSHLQMKVGSGDYFNIAEFGFDNRTTDYHYEINGDKFYFTRLSTYTQSIIKTWSDGTSDTDRPFWVRIQLKLKDGNQGKNISFKTNGEWEGGGSPGEKTVSFDHTPDATAIQTTDKTECSGVKIDWTVPSGLCSGSQAEIYRNNSLLTRVSASLTTYFDASAQNYTSYSYKVRFRKYMSAGWYNYGAFSPAKTGERKTVPDYPSGFVASDQNCDYTVDLSWDYTPDITEYKIRRGSTVIAILAKNVTTFQDIAPNRGVVYNYSISASNKCGWGAYSNVETGASPADPTPPSYINADIVPGIGVRVSWPDVELESAYKIERNLLGGGGSTIINLDEDVTSYLDTSLIACQTYEYRVFSINHCTPEGVPSASVARAKLVPDLSNTFHSNSLLASKGFFSNRVELNWLVDNNENFLNAYKIYRKILGSTEDSTVIATLNSGSNIYIDNLVDAGVLYEYTLIGETQCENATIYSNSSSSVGFRSPFGNISGNITYSGGIAVNGAKITASSTAQIYGKSMEFDGSGSLNIANNNTLNFDGDLLLETWFKPVSFDENFTLFDKTGSYYLNFNHSSDKFQFGINYNNGLTSQLTIDAVQVNIDNYTHIAAQLYQNSLKIFVNGLPVASKFVSNSTLIDNSSSDIIIGSNFTGDLDEIRIWNKGKSDELILQDFSRLMIGGETGLLAYLRMNEGTGNYAYDISKQGSLFNRNHAAIQGNTNWSASIPTNSQLCIAVYTDSLGNYLMTIPYSGMGEAFILSPSYLSHNFDPSTRALYVGDGSSNHSNIDFEDISSFKVEGDLFYQSTSCSVSGAYIKVDGENVIINGNPAQTDGTGHFIIQVPIGKHYLEVQQSGHIYSVGRFPAKDSYNFQADLAGITFQDSTLVKVVGRVAGGLREAAKIPGLGNSKNNLGVAEIIFESQQGNGCSTQVIYTDSTTGEYTAYLPPMKYIPSLKIVNNPAIKFGVLDILDISGTPVVTNYYDSVFNADNELIRIDSVQYNKQLDYIYRVDPKIIVKGPDGINDFIGDSIYNYIDAASGDTIVRNLRTDPLEWPVFHQQDSDFLYRCLIKVYEEYTNYDNFVLDSVPCTDGRLIINNEISHYPDVQINMSDVNTPDVLKFLIYSFKPGTPNFLDNKSIPEYGYTKKFSLSLETNDGTILPWLPVPTEKIPTGGDAVYRGLLLGGQSTGDQFVTTGPQIPEYILRDPPGSESTASREKGSTKSEVRSWKWNLGATASTEDNIYLGAKFNVGLGVSTATEIENNVTAGFSAEVTGGNSGSMTLTTTNTKSWSTSGSSDLPGAGSDLYIGKAQNVQFGIAEHLALVPDSLSGKVDCLGHSFGGFSYAKKYGLSVIPGGYETNFIYDQNHIINYLIPDLENLRSKILQTNSKFTSNLNLENPNYGKNNDDPIFGTAVSTATPDVGEYADFNGLSYIYVPATLQDSLSGDSVRFINDQILKWEEAISLNEWEKANIDNPTIIDSLKNVELDNLWDEYKASVIAYNILIAVNGVGAATVAYGIIATPCPGTAFAGYATFAVTTATGIAQAELFEECKRYYALKERIEKRFSETSPTNYSISGGNEFSSSISQESASTYTRSIEYNMSASLKLEVKGKVNNNGVGFEKSIEMKFSSGKDWTTESSDTESVGFTLSDPDQGDYFSVDVYPSLLGWGPVFKTKAGGKTSCPHEDKAVTQYYKPGTVINERTLQREKPVISISPDILTNVPVDGSAVFNLTLGNASESGDGQIYAIDLSHASNPFGALVSIDGFSPSQSVSIPAGSSINKVLIIEKGPGAVYDYDSLLVVLHSTCQYASGNSDNVDIVDSVYVSAHFIPTCTNVALASPEEQWVLNNSFDNLMPVALNDYDINFFDLEKLRFEYKPSNEANWTGLQTFWKDTTGMSDPELSLIAENTPFTLYDWDVEQMTDGNYDLRVTSMCALADNISITYKGIIDRINPHAFGNPQPADGILEPNDEISIKFNEAIDLGSLSSKNFDIIGVLNGTKTNHSTSLSFDGTKDYLDIPAGASLQNRDFTIEFSARRMGTGEQTILSQGPDPKENLFIGFNSSNNFVARINGTEIASSRVFNDNEWHNFAVSYDYDNSTIELFVIDQTMNGIVNIGNSTIYDKFSGSGKILIGKNIVNDDNFFKGNIHELRIWNTSRTLSEFSLLSNQLLNGHEKGLVYNWRIGEAEGIVAVEHVRRRDANIYGAAWQVDPNGNAVSFNGSDNYLKVSSSDIVITDEMNFTLEFWFKSSQTEASTLFSNGSATNSEADSLYSWNICKDDKGLIHVKNYGLDFEATSINYFDNDWHHFALVLKRSGNLSAYMDGELQNSVNATSFKQFASANLYLGAKGVNLNTENIDNFYNGQMDEFRFWNAARKQEQIKRDKQNRMKGNEPALLIYLPFENYQLDLTGIPILTPAITEQIKTEHVITGNLPELIAQTPTIKLQRPIESVAFTFSVNNDEIIFTPTTSQELIENVTLDVTVKNVKDLQGNSMQSPETWIAYIDKNQVIWDEQQFDFEKVKNADLSFTATILNKGGELKEFSIDNVPEWLTASPKEGEIEPNSYKKVNFTLNPAMNIGSYHQDIYLHTDFNFDEKLTLNIKVYQEPPVWEVNPEEYQYSMSIIGSIKIGDIFSTDEDDRIGAFVGEECRGMATLSYIESYDKYLVFMDVYSNNAGISNTETINYRVWNASDGLIHTDVDPVHNFAPNDIKGSPSNPVVFHALNSSRKNLMLPAGWKWISFNLNSTRLSDINLFLESLNPTEGDQIKGANNFASFTPEDGWNGSLCNNGITLDEMYMIRMSKPDTLIVKGEQINPGNIPVNLKHGWNRIGFLPSTNMSVENAFGQHNPQEGDLIKSQEGFAIYDASFHEWIGTLSYLKPGNGYMYYSSNTLAVSFNYPLHGLLKSALSDANNLQPWYSNSYKYSSTMNIMAQLDLEIPESGKYDYALGAFINNECRGYTYPVNYPGLDKPVFFLSITGEQANDQIKFRLINTKNMEEFYSSTNTLFMPEQIMGEINNFFEINFETTGINIDDPLASSMRVYPNPFHEELSIQIGLLSPENIRMEIFGTKGEKIIDFGVLDLPSGISEIKWKGNNSYGKPLPSGIYLIRMIQKDRTQMKRIEIIR